LTPSVCVDEFTPNHCPVDGRYTTTSLRLSPS
jgi:hypothetical protein